MQYVGAVRMEDRLVIYQEAVSRIWRPSQAGLSDEGEILRELVRYATLAPSGHNTQCWRFRIDGRSITVSPDLSRRTPVVDPDDHHLYASLGCAIENLIQAAHAFGFEPETEFEPASGATTVKLTPAVANESPLFRAIAGRQCKRIEFDGKPLTRDELDLLAVAGTGRCVHVVLLTERSEMEKALDFVVQGNTMQVENPAFVRELESWIRFSDEEAIRCGDGLSARVTGNPSAPRWLGKALFRAFSERSRRTTSTRARFEARRVLRCSSPRSMMSRTGSRPDGAMSASRYRPLRSAFEMRSSTSL